jgi:diguanylate cyclase (GGDEF)-like protein
VQPSALHTARPTARAGLARFVALSTGVVAALVLIGSAAFVVGGGDAVRLVAVGALLVATGGAACSLVYRGERRRHRAGLQALIELGRELENVRAGDDLTVMFAQYGRTRLGFERVVVLTRTADSWEGAISTAPDIVSATGPVQIGPLAERIWRTGAPKVVRSLAGDSVLDELLPAAHNIVVGPLVADGKPVGVVLAEWGRGRRTRIPAVTVETLVQSASQTAVALRNAALLAEVESLATRDGLTRLANRRLFEETLNREMARSYRRSTPLSLVVLDVDHFKDVNDSAGHQTGDAVLREIGRTLVRNTKASDLAARYGGDEFVVLLPECSGADALRVAERLRAAVARHVTAVPVTVSGGVGEMPGNAGDGERLVAAADAALYAAKRDGRNRSVRSDRVAEPGEVPPHPSLLPRPVELDGASPERASRNGVAADDVVA